MSNKNSGHVLRGYMKRRGIRRQHELAQVLGLSDALVSQYLNGKRYPSARTAMRIVERTGIPIEALYR